MFIIGEKLNCSVKRTREAAEAFEGGYISRMARKQAEAGANILDINAGVFTSREPEMLVYIMREARKASDLPFMLDSPSCDAMRAALEAYDGPTPIINSLSLESGRLEGMLELAKEFKTRIVALCMDDAGVPESADVALNNARRLFDRLTSEGIAPDDIFLDPLVRPLATGAEAVSCFLRSVACIKAELKGAHIICGLSNISYGLPDRKLINRTFLALAMQAGVDAMILDPLDRQMIDAIYATNALLGNDSYCSGYLGRYRSKMEEKNSFA